MNDIVLTIGVPVFNEHQIIQETIDSLYRLKRAGVQIIISDNASSDGTVEIIEKSVEESQQFEVILQPTNLGVLENMRQISLRAQGKYILYLGAGDLLHDNALDLLLNLLKGGDYYNVVLPGTVGGGNAIVPQGSVVTSSQNEGNFYSESICLNVMRTSAVKDFFLSDQGVTGDWWPHIEIILRSKRVWNSYLTVSSPNFVRIHPNNHGWWYHNEGALEGYISKLKLLESEQALTAESLRKMRNSGFLLFVFEVCLNGKGFSPYLLLSTCTEDIQSRIVLSLALLICKSPRWALRAISKANKNRRVFMLSLSRMVRQKG